MVAPTWTLDGLNRITHAARRTEAHLYRYATLHLASLDGLAVEDLAAAAWQPAFRARVQAALVASEPYRRWSDLRGRLAEAEAELAALERRRRRLEIEREEALATRSGTTLTKALSAIQARLTEIAVEMQSSDTGLAVLRTRVAESEQAARDELQALQRLVAAEVGGELRQQLAAAEAALEAALQEHLTRLAALSTALAYLPLDGAREAALRGLLDEAGPPPTEVSVEPEPDTVT